MAGEPFRRGFNRTDMLFAVLLQNAADFHSAGDVQAAADLIGYEDSRTFTPSGGVAPAVTVVRCTGFVFVCCGSTQNKTQWVGNVLGSAAVPIPGAGGPVSAYFGGVASAYRAAVLDTVRAWMPGRSVVVLGFSLGSAAGVILGALLRNLDGIDVAVATYGPPRPGTTTFATNYPVADAQRLTLINDPVGSVPPALWAGSGDFSYWTPFPPLVVYRQPGAGMTLGLGGGLSPGDYAIGVDELALSWDLDLWGKYHNPYQYAWNLRLGLPDTIPNGWEGYPHASRFDAVAGALFTAPGPVWPKTPFTPTPLAAGGTMATILSVFISDVDDPLGFVETYAFSGDDPGSVLNQWNAPGDNLESKRLSLMSSQAQIYAVRAAVAGASPRNSQFQKYRIPKPGLRSEMDRIEDCISFFGFNQAQTSKRQFHFRAVPKTWIDGDKLTALGEGWIDTFLNFLDTYRLRQGGIFKPLVGDVYDLTSATQAAAGAELVLTTKQNSNFQANDLLIIKGCKLAPLLNGQWKVSGNSGSATSFNLGGSGRYSAPATINGTVRKITGPTITPLATFAYDGVGTKKTGRPSFLQRGRRSPKLKHR